MGASKIRFELRDFSSFSQEAWNRLYLESGNRNAFYHYSFLKASRVLSPMQQCQEIIAGYRGGELVFAQPVKRIGTTVGNILQFYKQDFSDHIEPLISPSEGQLTPAFFNFDKERLASTDLKDWPDNRETLLKAPESYSGRPDLPILEAFWAFVMEEFQPDLMVGLSLSHPFYAFMKEKSRNHQVLTDEEKTYSPIIEAGDCIDTFLSRLKKKTREDIRRKYRSAKKKGVQFRVITPEHIPENYSLLQAFENVTNLHAMRFNELDKCSYFLREEVQRFHKQLLEETATGKPPVIFVEAILDGKVIGSNYGFFFPHQSIGFQHGFDPAFYKLGMGNNLLYQTLQYMTERGVPSFDFKGGIYEYKLRWTQQVVIDHDLYVGFTPKAVLLKEYFLWEKECKELGIPAGFLNWMRIKAVKTASKYKFSRQAGKNIKRLFQKKISDGKK